MAVGSNDFDRALKVILSAELRYPNVELLECFLRDSQDPQRAGRYVLENSLVGQDEFDLLPLVSDWKQLIALFTFEESIHEQPDGCTMTDIKRRDGGRCCVTGLSDSIWDPLVIVPIWPLPKSMVIKPLEEMLGAFVGPELRDWMLLDAPNLDTRQNHWCIRKAAAAALSQGFFQFEFIDKSKFYVSVVDIGGPVQPAILDKVPVLRSGYFTDHSSSGIALPETRSLQVLSQFARSIRWTVVAKEIASQKPQAVTSRISSGPLDSYLEHGVTLLLEGWRRIPSSLRLRAYDCLAYIGARLYGPTCSLKVQQLPFGMYLKTSRVEWHQGLANEYEALRLVRRYTNIPTPRPMDLVSTTKMSYLLTSQMPGMRLGSCIDTLTVDEEQTLVQDLQTCLEELRAIPKEVASENAITNALGQACYDYRINAALDYDEVRGDFIGPFSDEKEFNATLRCGALPNITHRGGHKIVFTHGDLNMRNVLVHNGRLSGIVDWENSGWYPEYWDYTKAHYITKLKKRWLRMVDEVFHRSGDFEHELEIERQLWDYCF